MQLLPQAYNPETFRAQGHALIDQLADYLQQQLSGTAPTPILPVSSPNEQLAHWQEMLTQTGPVDLSALFQATLNGSLHLHHPHYVGHQVAAPLPLAALASMVSSLLNNGMAVYETGPVSTAMEQAIMKEMAQQVGYPEGAGGFMTSGGTLSNLTALLAARRMRAPEDVWLAGTKQRFALMVSEQAHYCVDRAARIMGWGDEGVILVPTDDAYRMRTDLLPTYLADAQEKGLTVLAVVGSACTTSTGSYDDLQGIADFCEAENLWFHVDGAHGGPAVFSEKYRPQVTGIARADSITIDFHKMMLLPAPTTALLFRREPDSFRTFAQKAQYLWEDQEQEEWHNLAKRTFECTKRMMSLVAYTVWRTYGPQIFAEAVEGTYDLAHTFAQQLDAHPDLELALMPQANIICFRYRIGSRATDFSPSALNASIRAQVVEEGDFYLVQTQLKGETWLRTTLMNAHTTTAHLADLLARVVAVGNGLVQG